MDAAVCEACHATARTGAIFCGRCGHRLGDRPPALLVAPLTGWRDMNYVLIVYFMMLGGQAITLVVARLDASFTTVMLLGNALLVGVTTITAIPVRHEIAALYRHPGFKLLGYTAVVVASYPIALGVSGFVHLMRDALEQQAPAERALGLGWDLVTMCVIPPIFEELQLRGTIFTVLLRRLAPGEAMIVTAAAFALLHLSIPSLVTHVPLGLYFCWLRYRSASLWPAMLAHLLHNGWVLLDGRVKVLF